MWIKSRKSYKQNVNINSDFKAKRYSEVEKHNWHKNFTRGIQKPEKGVNEIQDRAIEIVKSEEQKEKKRDYWRNVNGA